ncbi:MAG: hypothetical protein ACR2LT_03365 [Pyrinomonadaceae bacterium]
MTDNKNTKTAETPENKQSAQVTVNTEKTAAKTQAANNQQTDEQSIKKMANNAVGQAKEKAAGLLDEQKSKATTGLNNVADSIRKVGENLRDSDEQNSIAQTAARYGDSLAQQIENLSGYLEDAKLKDLTRDIEGFARRQPALFVGGAFLVGVLAARFLKTSAPDQNSSRPFNANRRENNSADGGSVNSATASQSV